MDRAWVRSWVAQIEAAPQRSRTFVSFQCECGWESRSGMSRARALKAYELHLMARHVGVAS